ncbi:KIR1, NAC domain containing protein 74 [Hibiscus trionum]|uniref:KIR1, NAC domain containing protein 74 n=1 Tax=Hibiscus trionum TaxID=183268 RepID=A0A9W7LQY7_HIBTR|nr:KIR1, NAC domain containing protein 74 [Hibiscus trionum]
MGLRDIGATLPPGFRFYPSDEELVCHYLYKKIANEEVLKGTLVEIDLHTCEPWQLPEVAKLNANEWYFFSFRDRKYATGFRTNRATTSGYWKATGKDRTVIDPITQEVVGMRKTLVFYMNRAPNGIKTAWIMHEFRLETPHMPPKEDWVLCRVFHKSKGGENSTEMSPRMMYEASTQTSMACGGYRQISCSLSATPAHHQPHGQSLLNLLHSSQLKNNNNNSFSNHEVSSKVVDDDYEFLWDMNMEDHHHVQGHGVADSNLEDIRFEVDNSMIVL